MKKYFLWLLLLLQCNGLYAQLPLDSIYTNGAMWSQQEQHGVGFNQFIYRGYSYMLQGDTIINSLVYKKISFANVFGGIRTDSGKVYFIRTDTVENNNALWLSGEMINSFPPNRDTILYDFNIKTGDTVKWKFKNKVVIKTDTVGFLNGTSLRRYIFAFDTHYPGLPIDYWLDGLGGNRGLFGSYSDGHIQIGSVIAACYTRNGNVYALPSLYFSWCYPVGIPVVNKTNKIEIYPNPLNDNKISISSETPVRTFKIYDAMNRLVFEQNNIQPGNHTIEINLPEGVYIAMLNVGEETIIKKIIKL